MIDTTETSFTSNGHSIAESMPVISAIELKTVVKNEFGLDGDTPAERIQQLKALSVEGIAILLEYINRSVQGSAESLISFDKSIRVGDENTIATEGRYAVFHSLVENIKKCPDDMNPERVADVLALGVVLLHPFYDGNGRTARVVGLIFRDDYDDNDAYQHDFDIITEPRDVARKRGGYMIFGYIPVLPEGKDRSNASHVTAYLESLLHEESDGAYTSCYGQARLHV